jgi:hypothetical protein
MSPHVQWTPVLLSKALLAHGVYVCLERPSGARPPEVMSPGVVADGRRARRSLCGSVSTRNDARSADDADSADK